MKVSQPIKDFLSSSASQDLYWTERAKLDFARRLEKQRLGAKITYKDLALKIGTSAAYISKVFRGDSNLTIESMVKLANSVGGRLQISIVHQTEVFEAWNPRPPGQTTKRPMPQFSAVTYVEISAANHERYSLESAA